MSPGPLLKIKKGSPQRLSCPGGPQTSSSGRRESGLRQLSHLPPKATKPLGRKGDTQCGPASWWPAEGEEGRRPATSKPKPCITNASKRRRARPGNCGGLRRCRETAQAAETTDPEVLSGSASSAPARPGHAHMTRARARRARSFSARPLRLRPGGGAEGESAKTAEVSCQGLRDAQELCRKGVYPRDPTCGGLAKRRSWEKREPAAEGVEKEVPAGRDGLRTHARPAVAHARWPLGGRTGGGGGSVAWSEFGNRWRSDSSPLQPFLSTPPGFRCGICLNGNAAI